MRNLELPGRSPVLARRGMAATSHYLASLTALDVLRDGGTAMDAAVAACAVQGVVEPGSTGIGGCCFALYAPGGGDEIVAFNGSSRAPAAATSAKLRDQGLSAIPRQSPHAALVPGAVDAWDRLLKAYGRKELGEVLQPAIRLAREGYPIYQRVARDFAAEAGVLGDDPHTAAVFLPDGRAPRMGAVHRQPALAETLARIARHGRDAFYEGEVARDIVERLQELGGLHTLDDFAQVAGEFVAPIHTDYNGYQVHECPPNGQGVIALEMLNILAGTDRAKHPPLSPERLHLEIEAARLAYADRDAVLADPDAGVPVETLLSAGHAAAQRARIDPARAMQPAPESPLPAHPSTVYITVVDAERNCASFINSLFNVFGSGITAPASGVLLNSRGRGFTLAPDHPNAIGPRKRPLHTIIPGMLCRDGRAVMPFGVMGGHYQAAGHSYFLGNVLDYGMDVQEAMDQPRLFPDAPDSVEVESGMPAEAVEGLKRLGHRLVPAAAPIGGAQAIWIDWSTGLLNGGSEPRKDGFALGY